MKKNAPSFSTVDQYIASFEPTIRQRLERLRALVHEIAPQAAERISYDMPTFDVGKASVYFAAFAKHIGFYPGAAAIEHFRERISGYKSAKGSVQFPLTETLPEPLIREMIRFRLGL